MCVCGGGERRAKAAGDDTRETPLQFQFKIVIYLYSMYVCIYFLCPCMYICTCYDGTKTVFGYSFI